MERIILHSDLNNFFASVECAKNPSLLGHPVAVAGDVQKRHGIVLAKNREAKAYGIMTGHTLCQARALCPDIIFVQPHYELYDEYSRRTREIYKSYTDLVEPFGIDECWLDISLIAKDFSEAEKIANEIREKVKAALGITVSVGVSFNKIFAKLGSDVNKYDSIYVITPANFRETVWKFPASDLLFVGKATKKKLFELSIRTIGDLARYSPEILEFALGKNGLMLHSYANGLDRSPVISCRTPPILKSVSNSTTPPKDIVTENDAKITLYALCENISSRMRRASLVCSTVSLSVRDTKLCSCERQTRLEFPNRCASSLFEAAFSLLCKNGFNKIPLRSIGVCASGIMQSEDEQLSFIPAYEKLQRMETLEATADEIRSTYGKHAIQRGIMFTDSSLAIDFSQNKLSFGSDARLFV